MSYLKGIYRIPAKKTIFLVVDNDIRGTLDAENMEKDRLKCEFFHVDGTKDSSVDNGSLRWKSLIMTTSEFFSAIRSCMFDRNEKSSFSHNPKNLEYITMNLHTHHLEICYSKHLGFIPVEDMIDLSI
jgi:hypothetical protein